MTRSFLALLLGGCMSSSSTPDVTPQPDPHPLPTTTGSFAGRYVVPTPPELAAAATFGVGEVDWLVTGTNVSLEYALPVGLVGGKLRVSLAGQLPAPGESFALTGVAGSGTCTGSATTILCHEVFTNLGTLPISADVVRQTATTDYGGPVADRMAVADLFSSDPIGNIEIDLSSPVAFGSDGHTDNHGGR